MLLIWIISLPFLVSCQLEDRVEKGSGLPDPSDDLPTVTEEYGVGRTAAGHPTKAIPHRKVGAILPEEI